MRFICTQIFLFIFLFSNAQPNPGFEDWEVQYGYECPVGWQTLNILAQLPSNSPSVFKVSGIDKHSGNYALKLKTVFLATNPIPNLVFDTAGAVFSGFINPSPLYFRRGFNYSGRPEKLNVWYKYFPVGLDSGSVGAILTKWNGVKQDTIAIADSSISYNPVYKFLQVDFLYLSDEVPDTATIVFASSRLSDNVRVNSTLFVDDVSFSGWVAVDEYVNGALISVFPIPAKEEVHFKIDVKENIQINIFDIVGKQIGKLNGNDKELTLDTKNYVSGVYFYELIDKKNSLLTRGKFTVEK
ncbi:MAG: T9SS type A sorting domain-containing protein [Bacteroidia bacterium]